METLTNQLAVAIENSRLYEALQQELSEREQAEQMLWENQALIGGILDTVTLQPGETGRVAAVDAAYLAELGLTERWPLWQRCCEEMINRGDSYDRENSICG